MLVSIIWIIRKAKIIEHVLHSQPSSKPYQGIHSSHPHHTRRSILSILILQMGELRNETVKWLRNN